VRALPSREGKSAGQDEFLGGSPDGRVKNRRQITP
jgi:hypothetical protein